MKKSTKYELKIKQRGHGWRVYNTYTDKNDPVINAVTHLFKSRSYVESVKLVTVTTTREDEYL